MKTCPECSAQYEDSVGFCAKDGRALVQRTAAQTRLCPHCANGIPEDAAICPYCKAEVGAVSEPQWPTREDDGFQAGLAMHKQKFPTSAKVALVFGFALGLIGLVLTGKAMLGPQDRSETRQLAEEKIKELQEKEQKIQTLEEQLAKVRQELADTSGQMTALKGKLADTSGQITALKGKLADSERELSTTQQRLNIVSREVDRLTSARAQTRPPPAPRPADTAPSPAPLPSRRPADPGTYEVIRETEVREDPAVNSRVLSQIRRGTKVTVVRSVGDWLEVRSKHGNPPGFISRDDAMFVSKAN